MELEHLRGFIELVVLFGFWIVFQPLKPALASLENSINSLCVEIVALRQQASDNRAAISALKESCKDAHYRIKSHDDRLKELEHKCDRCKCGQGM